MTRDRFNPDPFLASAGISPRVAEFGPKASVYSQGDRANAVMYLQRGAVKLSVVSRKGKEAVVAILGPGDFFGEGCLAGQKLRERTATAVLPSTVLIIGKQRMIRLLQEQPALSERFMRYVLNRNIRIEDDLVDQLFNSSEKRLVRTLVLLTEYGRRDKSQRVLPRISQETLAEMIGTTRSRVNFFLNKFRRQGLIEYNGGLKINRSLLRVALND